MLRSLLLLAVVVPICLAGTSSIPVTCGSLIKLQHVDSSCRLHSHNIPYGFGRGSGQQSVTCYPNLDSAESYWVVTCEVSCFGSATESDEGDLWRIEWDTGKHGKQWRQDFPISLQHVATKQFLASQNQQFSHPIQGHTEVYAAKKATKLTKWAAAEGVYLSIKEA